MSQKTDICPHGILERQCGICELTADVADLRDRAERAESECNALRAENEAWREASRQDDGQIAEMGAEIADMAQTSGEALGTHPDMRSTACVGALAGAYASACAERDAMQKRIATLETALLEIEDWIIEDDHDSILTTIARLRQGQPIAEPEGTHGE